MEFNKLLNGTRQTSMLNSPTFLITGVSSGLGKFLYNSLPSSIGLTRENSKQILSADYDNLVILHSAFNSKKNIPDYSQYVEDNYVFTQKLMHLKYKKFVYFSTVDIYNETFNPYSFMKKCVEDYIYRTDPTAAIIRLSAILGPEIRRNSLVKLINEEDLTLQSISDFNYILQSDILDALDKIRTSRGVFNFTSRGSVTLGKIAEYYNKSIKFGNYRYNSNASSYEELVNLYPYSDRTSMDVVKLFLEDNND